MGRRRSHSPAAILSSPTHLLPTRISLGGTHEHQFHRTSRLYALTAVACAIWLFQNCVEANASGDLLSWSNIILSICLIIVTGYCAVNAVLGWNTKSADTEDPSK